jgi:hypothetical protein
MVPTSTLSVRSERDCWKVTHCRPTNSFSLFSALNKANEFYDQNLELLASINHLKNEIQSNTLLFCRKEEVGQI